MTSQVIASIRSVPDDEPVPTTRKQPTSSPLTDSSAPPPSAPTTAVGTHHRFARYGWVLTGPDGTPAVDGSDFAELDDAGRLVRVVGFFGPVTAKASGGQSPG